MPEVCRLLSCPVVQSQRVEEEDQDGRGEDEEQEDAHAMQARKLESVLAVP